MARSELGTALRRARREREASLTPDERSIRALEAARQGFHDYAATHGITYGEARRRLKAAARVGRAATTVFDE